MLLAACGSAAPASPSPPEQTKPAATILADAAATLDTVSSFTARGMLDPGVGVDLTVNGSQLAGTVTSHAITWDVNIDGSTVLFRGRALWDATAPAQAAAFDARWVRVDDPHAGYGLAGELAHFRYGLSHIIFGPHPAASAVSQTSLSGTAVIELRGGGDTYDVAATGTPWPLRWLDSDIAGPDGRPCGITLADFGSAPAVAVATPGAVLSAPPSPTATP